MVRHVHITGTPRSGTTLLLELMRCCYDWDWAPENEVPVIRAVRRRRGRTLSKYPSSNPGMKAFLSDSGSWLMYCQRDPRDVVCSRHASEPDVYWTNLAMWRRMREIRAGLEKYPRFILIRYEQLVSNPDLVQRQIEARLPWLQRKLSFSEFHNAAQPASQSSVALHGVRPISEASVGLWRQNLERMAGQLAQHGPITSELVEEGYESDDLWLNALENVEPDLTPSRWPESIPKYHSPKVQFARFRDAVKLRYLLFRQRQRRRQR